MEKPKKVPLHALTGTGLPVANTLPSRYFEGIGKIIVAHAIVEKEVSELIFDLAQIDYSIGRAAFRYQAASERFKLAKRLMVMHGIEPPPPLVINELLEQITDCCNIRDQFAHCVWLQIPPDRIALRVTKGEFETEQGIIDRTALPQALFIPEEFDYFEEQRHVILITAAAVSNLRQHVTAWFRARLPKS
jgi:hypothetical protein